MTKIIQIAPADNWVFVQEIRGAVVYSELAVFGLTDEGRVVGMMPASEGGLAPIPDYLGRYVSRKDLPQVVKDLKNLVSTAKPMQPRAPLDKFDMHPATEDLVRRFALALEEKLAQAETRYGYSDGWKDPAWIDECREKLAAQVLKGDPRDVAAYCAFLWHHGESTTKAAEGS